MKDVKRRLPVGAEPGEGGTHFRVWAPRPKSIELVVEGSTVPLERDAEGYASAFVEQVTSGARYHFRLEGRDYIYPDPASRSQPDGPHGRSMVIDPRGYRWSDAGWKGPALTRNVIYELHVGTFTSEGTFTGVIPHLERLARLGVTVLEIMPVAEFPGRFGWGYDGVDLWAPSRLYGSPDDLRALVDAAHAAGLAIILDVVYNHLGPDGNYLAQFSSDYFTDRYPNEWGEAINFDGPGSRPVREFFIANAAHWISEYHFDGLRVDATQQIFDCSEPHVLAEISDAVRRAAGERQTLLVAENEPQDVRTILPSEEGGHGLDLVWNDDFHHAAIVALTGRNDAYYTDYLGKPQEFVSAAKWGFLYQGQWYLWQKKRRGTVSLDQPAFRYVWFLENHDQVANSGRGERLQRLTDPGSYRAMTALLLLGPATPMLFQGQEFGSSAPFLYFADHEPELAEKVSDGRREFLTQFRALAAREMRHELPSPHDPSTFERCRLDHSELEGNREVTDLYADLLDLRRTDPTFLTQERSRIDGAVLASDCFLLRHLREEPDEERLLIVNLGREMQFRPMPEPLMAPPAGHRWEILWSSESPAYGGSGTPEVREREWRIPGRACVVFGSVVRRSEGAKGRGRG